MRGNAKIISGLYVRGLSTLSLLAILVVPAGADQPWRPETAKAVGRALPVAYLGDVPTAWPGRLRVSGGSVQFSPAVCRGMGFAGQRREPVSWHSGHGRRQQPKGNGLS
jgi:hypothetical protein